MCEEPFQEGRYGSLALPLTVPQGGPAPPSLIVDLTGDEDEHDGKSKGKYMYREEVSKKHGRPGFATIPASSLSSSSFLPNHPSSRATHRESPQVGHEAEEDFDQSLQLTAALKKKKAPLAFTKAAPTATSGSSSLSSLLSRTDKPLSMPPPHQRPPASLTTAPVRGAGKGKSGAAINRAAPKLWCEEYKPTEVEDLVINKKKAESVLYWFTNDMKMARLLILYGPPGTGKSTMVDVILRSLGCDVRVWSDRPVGGSGSFISDDFSSPYVSQLDDFSSPYVSQLDDFKTFLVRSKHYSPLALTTTTAAGGTTVAGVPTGVNGKSVIVMEELPNIQQGPRGEEKRRILQQTLLSFASTSQNVGVLIISSLDGDPVHLPGLKRSLSAALLESPYVHLVEINPPTVPTIVKALRRVVKLANVDGVPEMYITQIANSCSQDLRHAVNTIQFEFSQKQHKGPLAADSDDDDWGWGTTATTTKGAKPSKRSKASPDVGNPLTMPKGWSVPSSWQVVVKESKSGAGAGKKQYISPDGGKKCNTVPEVWRYINRDLLEGNKVGDDGEVDKSKGSCGKGAFFDDMHMLGKLLHGKMSAMEPSNTAAVDAGLSSHGLSTGGMKFTYNPERVIEHSSFEPQVVAAFISENCIEFFTDIIDVDTCLDLLSDVDLIAGCRWSGNQTAGNSHYIDGYITSITGRSVGLSNHHPASSGFRPIRRPQNMTIQTAAKVNLATLKDEFTLDLYGTVGRGEAEAGVALSCSSSALCWDVIPFLPSIYKGGTTMSSRKMALARVATKFPDLSSMAGKVSDVLKEGWSEAATVGVASRPIENGGKGMNVSGGSGGTAFPAAGSALDDIEDVD